jgi:serine O-acetyltransferase
MIKTRKDLKLYISEDKKRYGNVTSFTKIFGHSEQWYIWKVIYSVRLLEFYKNNCTNIVNKVIYTLLNIRHHKLMKNTGIYIFPNVFGPGLYIPHLGTIHVSGVAKIGKNCTIRPGVLIVSNLGVSNKKLRPIIIGDNVEFSEGCKILCRKIGDNVIVGPNCTVFKNIPNNTTVYSPQCKYLSHDDI